MSHNAHVARVLRRVVIGVAGLLGAAVIALAVVGPGTASPRAPHTPSTAGSSGTAPPVSTTSTTATTTTLADVAVPDVVTSARDSGLGSAQEQASALGLVLRTTSVKGGAPCDAHGHHGDHGGDASTVVAQTPLAGTAVRPGSVVVIFVCSSRPNG